MIVYAPQSGPPFKLQQADVTNTTEPQHESMSFYRGCMNWSDATNRFPAPNPRTQLIPQKIHAKQQTAQ
jgi:hypothetical protein